MRGMVNESPKMDVVDTAGAVEALRHGMRVEAVDLTFRKTWLRKRTKTKAERHEVLMIEPFGMSPMGGPAFSVTFAGGRVRVFNERATFWVGEENT